MVLHRCTDRYYARQQRVYEGQRLQTAPLTANHHAVELAETNEQGEVVASFAQLLSRLETALAVPSYPANLPPTGDPLRATRFENHSFKQDHLSWQSD